MYICYKRYVKTADILSSMEISKSIKKNLDTISGKRRITILNTYIKDAYKRTSYVLPNVVGEYSPKKIIEHLNLVVTYGKNMCANQGKGWSRYYSFARLQEINSAFAALASQYEEVDSKTGKTTLKNLLHESAGALEILKVLLGPFTDLKFESAVENITGQLTEHNEALQRVKDTAKETQKQANAIQKHFDKSEQASHTFETLIKETSSLQKQLKTQQQANNELHDRNRIVSKHIDKLQSMFEDKLQAIDILENDMVAMRSRIEEEYNATIVQSREFESVSIRMEETQKQTANIISQARHALNVSQGAGLLESYRELYQESAKLKEVLPWSMSAFISVVFIIGAGILNITNIMALPNIMAVFYDAALLAQLLIVPLGIFCLFFSVFQLRRKKQIKNKYHSRLAALETYLKLSEHLPYDSPEQMRTASQIMRFLEEDFNPIAVKAMFNANNQFSNAVPMV